MIPSRRGRAAASRQDSARRFPGAAAADPAQDMLMTQCDYVAWEDGDTEEEEKEENGAEDGTDGGVKSATPRRRGVGGGDTDDGGATDDGGVPASPYPSSEETFPMMEESPMAAVSSTARSASSSSSVAVEREVDSIWGMSPLGSAAPSDVVSDGRERTRRRSELIRRHAAAHRRRREADAAASDREVKRTRPTGPAPPPATQPMTQPPSRADGITPPRGAGDGGEPSDAFVSLIRKIETDLAEHARSPPPAGVAAAGPGGCFPSDRPVAAASEKVGGDAFASVVLGRAAVDHVADHAAPSRPAVHGTGPSRYFSPAAAHGGSETSVADPFGDDTFGDVRPDAIASRQKVTSPSRKAVNTMTAEATSAAVGVTQAVTVTSGTTAPADPFGDIDDDAFDDIQLEAIVSPEKAASSPAAAAKSTTTTSKAVTKKATTTEDARQKDRPELITSRQPLVIQPPTATLPPPPPAAEEDPFGDMDDDAFAYIDLAALTQGHDATAAATTTTTTTATTTTATAADTVPIPQQPTKGVSAPALETDDESFPDMDFDQIDGMIERYKSNVGGEEEKQIPHRPNFPSLSAPIENIMSDLERRQGGASAPCDYTCFDRYDVTTVDEDVATYTKIVYVETSSVKRPFCDGKGDGRNCDGDGKGVLYLRGEWFHTDVLPGDAIHLVSISGRWRTDLAALPAVLHSDPPRGSTEDDLVLVLRPDLLLSPSAIGAAMGCRRRAVIQHRLGSGTMSAVPAVLGTLRHEAFQKSVGEGDYSHQAVIRAAREVVVEKADVLVGIGLDDEEARGRIGGIAPQVYRFGSRYVRNDDGSSGLMESIDPGVGSVLLSATGTYGVEESALSPELGLCGSVDVTMSVAVRPAPVPRRGGGRGIAAPPVQEMTALMPFELKTGHQQRPTAFHMGQLSLYTMMLKTRHGSAVPEKCTQDPSQNGMMPGGALLYLNSEGMTAYHVIPNKKEVKTLINLRNSLARPIAFSMAPRGVKHKNRGRIETETDLEILPAPPADLPDLTDTGFCDKCFIKNECMLYKRTETLQSRNIALADNHRKIYSETAEHFSEVEIKYFNDWDRMVDLEADRCQRDVMKSLRKASCEFEKSSGLCISSLVWDANDNPIIGGKAALTFRRARPRGGAPPAAPFADLRLGAGDDIFVSTDGPLFGGGASGRRIQNHYSGAHLVRGVIGEISHDIVRISCPRVDASRLWNASVAWEEAAAGGREGDEPTYRIDKNERYSGTNTLRRNLTNLFGGGDEDDNGQGGEGRARKRLRQLIVKLEEPLVDVALTKSMFSALDSQTSLSATIGGCDFSDLTMEFYSLNLDQQKAVKKVISAKDYTLIQGLPGTGKSSLIVYLARLLAARGERVLITSYTHAAVDNLMVKLKENGVGKDGNLVRIGNRATCHKDVHDLLTEIKVDDAENSGGRKDSAVKELRERMNVARIVGVSALTAVRSPLLVGQRFDVVIVDEAGQMNQLACVGVLVFADTFVLAGDHMQLPPLTTSLAAAKAGFDCSMLKRLAEAFPEYVSQLTIQYRMHQDICDLCNKLVYKGVLKCANSKVGKGHMDLPHYPEKVCIPKIIRTDPPFHWMLQALNPLRPVVFLNTDGIRSKTPSQASEYTNGSSSPAAVSFDPLERSQGSKASGGGKVNEVEAALVCSIVLGFSKCGVRASDVGIICPYRDQLSFLGTKPYLSEMVSQGLEMCTIDRFQGRDKTVIVMSFVRSNADGKVGNLLSDFRRINVAFSRAKKKLILVGSFQTLSKGSDSLHPILNYMTERKWVVDLIEDSHLIYEDQ